MGNILLCLVLGVLLLILIQIIIRTGVHKGISNTVREEDLEHVISTEWDLSTQRIDCYGAFPQFEIPGGECVFIVEAEHKSGLISAFFRWLFPLKRDNPTVFKTNETKDYLRLYATLHKLGYNFYGCFIHTQRTDIFKVVFPINIANRNHIENTYDVTIYADITKPKDFYLYLKRDQQGKDFKEKMNDYLCQIIREKYKENSNDANFMIDSNEDGLGVLSDPEALDGTGYQVNRFVIQYCDLDNGEM